MTVFISIVLIIVILSVLALVHEFGHFIAARIFGVTVTEFSIFMGPKLFQHQSKKSGTKFTIRLLPLGGYCAFEDDVPQEQKENEQLSENAEDVTERPKTKLNDQVWWKRAIIYSAGVFMNIILAWVIAAVFVGISGFDAAKIAYVDDESVAAFVGIEEGDTLVKMNGIGVISATDEAIVELSIMDTDDSEESMKTHYTLVYKKENGKKSYYDVSKSYEFEISEIDGVSEKTVKSWTYEIVNKFDGKETEYYYRADYKGVNDEKTAYVCEIKKSIDGVETIGTEDVKTYNFGTLGNTNYGYTFTKNPLKMIGLGFKEMLCWVKSVYLSLYYIITGKVGLEAISSPIGITSLVNDVISAPEIESSVKLSWVILMTGLISANLAVMNFLPIPGLDGFYMVLIIIELLRGGKKIPEDKQNIISYIGLGLLLLLAIFFMGADIIKLFRG